jgi:hypothetical protein
MMAASRHPDSFQEIAQGALFVGVEPADGRFGYAFRVDGGAGQFTGAGLGEMN